MPRPGPRRPYVALRLDPAALAWVDEQAVARGLNRSQMLRLMLSYAQERLSSVEETAPVTVTGCTTLGGTDS
jgi:hypothetical protein